MYTRSQWEFSEEVSESFNEHVKQSVPHYNRIHEHISSISDYFATENGTVYDLGTATGETIRTIHARHPGKKLTYIGVDVSAPMIMQASKQCLDIPNVYLEVKDLLNYEFALRSDLIVAVLTLQFLPIAGRKQLIDRVFKSLNVGGAFIMVEKTLAPNSIIHDMYTHIHYEIKQSAGLSADEVLLKEQSLRSVMKPISVNDNMNMLQNAGFEAEIFFKEWQFTGFVAIKPFK
jgi:tRNA (cmo5U34)-methyltransferase